MTILAAASKHAPKSILIFHSLPFLCFFLIEKQNSKSYHGREAHCTALVGSLFAVLPFVVLLLFAMFFFFYSSVFIFFFFYFPPFLRIKKKKKKKKQATDVKCAQQRNLPFFKGAFPYYYYYYYYCRFFKYLLFPFKQKLLTSLACFVSGTVVWKIVIVFVFSCFFFFSDIFFLLFFSPPSLFSPCIIYVVSTYLF